MKTWDAFYPYVLPDVIGASDPQVSQALVLAAREFCDRTLVWQVDADPITTTPGVSEYDFDTSNNQEVIKFVSATLNGRDLPVIAEGDLPSNWRSNLSNQRECAFTLDRSIFTIVPTPAAAYDMTTKMVVRPSIKAAGVEDRIFNQYAAQIAFGAKAMLMMANSQPFSNPALAGVNRALFEDAIHRAALTNQRGYSGRRRRVSALNY